MNIPVALTAMTSICKSLCGRDDDSAVRKMAKKSRDLVFKLGSIFGFGQFTLSFSSPALCLSCLILNLLVWRLSWAQKLYYDIKRRADH